MCPNSKPDTMILAQVVLQIFCWQIALLYKMPVGKGDQSVKYIQNFAKIKQVIYTLNTICEPNIMVLAWAVLKIFCWHGSINLQCKIWKRGIIQSNSYRNLPKVNLHILTLDTIYVPNYMILAQAIHQVFCWQGPTGLQCISWKREIIQPNIYRTAPKS